MIADNMLQTLVFGVDLGTLLRHAIILIFSGLLIAAAVIDLRRFIIPNTLVVTLLALWPFWAIVNGAGPIGYTLLGALLMFGVGAVLFALGLMGGGDVKLLTVLALWAGLDGLLGLALLISVAGGILSIFWVSRWRMKIAVLIGWADGLRNNKQIPYGVAIAAGGLAVARRLWIG